MYNKYLKKMIYKYLLQYSEISYKHTKELFCVLKKLFIFYNLMIINTMHHINKMLKSF